MPKKGKPDKQKNQTRSVIFPADTLEQIEKIAVKKNVFASDVMSEQEYVANPIGFEVYGYIDKLIDHYNEKEMNYILANQDAFMKIYGV